MTKSKSRITAVQIFSVIIGLLFTLDVIFIIITQSEAVTISLLKKELVTLEQNNQIISSSKEIAEKYVNEIELISQVFPNEASIPEVIKELESMIKANADSYRLKFNSVTPVLEIDRQYLPLTLTINTDMPRLINLLTKFETLPYMTHINQISSKNNEGFMKNAEVIISIKLYVQNPFN